MAICRACDAPLKVAANYCVVCGAKQHRSRGLRDKFGARQLALAALACGVIAAAFSIGLGKPPVHEVRSPAAAIASNPLDLAAPAAYLEERFEEQDQGDPAITPQASATNNVVERRESTRDMPKSTATAATHSKNAKGTVNAPMVNAPMSRGAATVQQPLPTDRSSNLLSVLPSAASDGAAFAPPAPPAAPNPTIGAAVPSRQPENGANEPLPVPSETALIRTESSNVTYQGRTSSQATAAVRGPRTIDDIFRQRTVRCGDGVIGLLCRETLRLNVCNGLWTENPVPGMTVCYVAGR